MINNIKKFSLKVKDVSLIAIGLPGWFGLAIINLACLIVFVANVEQLRKGHIYFSSLSFFLMFIVAIASAKKTAPTIFIFLIPLLPTLSVQVTAFSGFSISSLPMAGFDLVAGYFLGLLLKHILYIFAQRRCQSLRDLAAPWPINAVLLVASFSTALAIYRNAWSSSSLIGLNAIPFSLFSFRWIDWFDDFRPLSDWMAYAMAGGSFVLAFNYLKFSNHRLAMVFRPLLAGLLMSGILAIIQSKTGMGFQDPPTNKDIFGYAPFGFQPDLHAYAGYTLLGAVGLWGYYSAVKTKLERAFILLIIVISWYGLIASISKATIFFAVLVSTIGFIWWTLKSWKKNYVLKLFWVTLLVLVLGGIVFLFAPTPGWLINLSATLKKLDFSNFNEFSSAFSYRPGIWLAALKMWINYPILGIGQGNFYQLSHFFNIANVPELIRGENAHNYFLQTLAEMGLVGYAAFAIAILMPFFLVKDRRVLMPAAVALFSLFLGNIYAHSFLVRENLFLAAILLGLMYSYVPQEKLALSPYKLLALWMPKSPWRIIFSISCFVIVCLGVREAYKSFYSFPFQYGTLCFVNKPLTPDGWSSGLYEIPLPSGSHGAELSIKVVRPNLQESPLRANFEILDTGNRVLASQVFEWRESGPQKLVISLPNDATIQDLGSKVALRLSSCYTPRNLGESIDGRRLGVIVDSSIIH